MTLKAIARINEVAAPTTDKDLEHRSVLWDNVTEAMSLLNMNTPKVQGAVFTELTSYSDAQEAGHAFAKLAMFLKGRQWKWYKADAVPSWTLTSSRVKALVSVGIVTAKGSPCVSVEFRYL